MDFSGHTTKAPSVSEHSIAASSSDDVISPSPHSSASFISYKYLSTTACATPASGDVLDEKKVCFGKAAEFASDFTTFAHPYPEEAYYVAKIGERDDDDRWPLWKRRLNKLAPLTSFSNIVTYLAYFSLRIYSTVSAQNKYHETFILAWSYIAAEICVAVPAMLQQCWNLMAIRGRRRPKLRLTGAYAPTVNVLITCCGEDVDVVLDTVRAACAVDYPSDRFRVTVTDDKADPDLKKATEDLKSTYPNLYYFARVKVKGVPHHFKAGNLIAATDFVGSLEGGQSEFLAPLDADMIPEEHWLRTLVAHMLWDKKCALACPPQNFMNIPDNDPLVESLDGFIHVMEPVKDACGVAWCTGSGYVIRMSALNDIGGWPTGSLAEDTYTSSMLLGKGWKTAYVHEALQFGTVPEDFASHLKQRTRWTLGTLQTAVKLRFCLWGPVARNMTFLQRLSGLVFCTDAFSKVFIVISLLTIPTVLLTGHPLVAYSTYLQLELQVVLGGSTHLSGRISEWILYLPAGYRQAQRDSESMIWMSPYHAITVIRSFLLPTWLGGKAMAFSSSGSQANSLNERKAELRAPLWRRLKVTIWDCKVWMHLLYLVIFLTAVILSFTRSFLYPNVTQDQRLLYILTHVGWPPLSFILGISAAIKPIKYAFFPPTMPDREELLDRDPKTGVARPKEYWKRQRWSTFNWTHELQVSTATVYTIICMIGVFFIHGWEPPIA